MADDLQSLIMRLIKDVDTPKLKPHRLEAKRIIKKYTPREIFNRWRNSEDGKQWKQEQFKHIKGKCPGCGHVLPTVAHFHIDHIKALRDRPDLAIEIENLQLLCSPCNMSKGATRMDIDLPS